MTMLTIPLEDALAQTLKLETTLTNTDEAAIIQKALRDYLRRQQMDRIREEMAGFARQAGFESEEDIYSRL